MQVNVQKPDELAKLLNYLSEAGWIERGIVDVGNVYLFLVLGKNVFKICLKSVKHFSLQLRTSDSEHY